MSMSENTQDDGGKREDAGHKRATTLMTPRTRARARKTFLRVLKQRANVTEAAAAAGISRFCAYNWREKSEPFAKAWAEAIEIATDSLEKAAWKRAVDGWTDEMGNGRTIHRYSDRLLERLLEAHRPTKYRPQQAAQGTATVIVVGANLQAGGATNELQAPKVKVIEATVSDDAQEG